MIRNIPEHRRGRRRIVELPRFTSPASIPPRYLRDFDDDCSGPISRQIEVAVEVDARVSRGMT